MTTQEKRKLMIFLRLPPFIVLLSALGFYALGGGRGDARTPTASAGKGMNTRLPDAQLKEDKLQDKMALYERSLRDSASNSSQSLASNFAALGWDTSTSSRQIKPPVHSALDNEAKIRERLAQINQQISQPPPVAKQPPANIPAASPSADLDKLEKLWKQKQENDAPDPEMQQLNTMLDKVLQIQNPASVKEAQQPDKTVVRDSAFKAIPAIIDGNQKVVSGGIVKLRLQDTIRITGFTIPKGQTVFGACVITNQRLLLDIRNLRLGTAIIPVNLTVFSLDGMAGIAAPEAELGEAVGSGANGALENMQFLSMNNGLSTEAATAGISAAKSLLGKKVRRIRVKLSGGQQVLLRLNKS